MDNLHQYKAADINYVIIFHLFSSVRSSQIRNVNSARVSFPGQLKRITSGQTATSELDSGIAVLSKTVPSIPSVTSTLDGRVSSVSRLSSQPLVEDSELDNSRSSEINSENNLKVDQNSTSLPSFHNDADSLQYNTENVSLDSSKFSSQFIGESIHSISGSTLPSFTDSSTISKHSGLVTCQSDRPQYTWRIDLIKTQPFWQGWFSGLSKLFLSIPEPKLLLLADADRLDKDLTIGQMQAKYTSEFL
ncbi:unnamed protein product [Schistosoma mattheei]|uniref:Protein phosphatase methylesterase-1 n=1 Tax=Schistosoma mattheei TaxID=31246 RepID=A0A3P7YX31_9TREM|nr:unnamed protein product [Schistosoma mattheei]